MIKRFYWLLLFVAPLLAACGAGRDGIVVESVWGRPTPATAQNGAFYMTIANHTDRDDALQAVRTDACETVELHQTAVDENGVMQMRPVEDQTILIPAGETVQLAVGGLHVMCLGVTEPFSVDRDIPLTLLFANAGEIAVNAKIRQDAP